MYISHLTEMTPYREKNPFTPNLVINMMVAVSLWFCFTLQLQVLLLKFGTTLSIHQNHRAENEIFELIESTYQMRKIKPMEILLLLKHINVHLYNNEQPYLGLWEIPSFVWISLHVAQQHIFSIFTEVKFTYNKLNNILSLHFGNCNIAIFIP